MRVKKAGYKTAHVYIKFKYMYTIWLTIYFEELYTCEKVRKWSSGLPEKKGWLHFTHQCNATTDIFANNPEFSELLWI